MRKLHKAPPVAINYISVSSYMRNDLALVSAHPAIEPLFVYPQSIRKERKETLTFTSLTFLFFWSLLLNYLFLLVYLLWN